jgi:hypothetical protein
VFAKMDDTASTTRRSRLHVQTSADISAGSFCPAIPPIPVIRIPFVRRKTACGAVAAPGVALTYEPSLIFFAWRRLWDFAVLLGIVKCQSEKKLCG